MQTRKRELTKRNIKYTLLKRKVTKITISSRKIFSQVAVVDRNGSDQGNRSAKKTSIVKLPLLAQRNNGNIPSGRKRPIALTILLVPRIPVSQGLPKIKMIQRAIVIV